jgi:hypothetical protein
MITEFSNKSRLDAHSAFQDWRRKNPNAYYLTMKTRTKYVLRSALCHHLDDDVSESDGPTNAVMPVATPGIG